MIIDFHTHILPDEIAKRALPSLLEDAKIVHMTNHTELTKDSLLSHMDNCKVDLSVVCPVVTNPKQFESVNTFAKSINESTDRLISLGGIHPKNENLKEKLSYIKSLGLKGVKIHPDYQNTYFNDEGYFEILKTCYELGLIVVTHAGKDPAYSDNVGCPPQMAREVIDRLYKETKFETPFISLAHLGGMSQYDEVEKYLIGVNAYFDISNSFHLCEKDQIVRIIRNHGADKILFATDSPWQDQKDYIDSLNSLEEISDNEKEMIFSNNAKRLLSL